MLPRARKISMPHTFRVVGACSAPVREQHGCINKSGDDWPLPSAVVKVRAVADASSAAKARSACHDKKSIMFLNVCAKNTHTNSKVEQSNVT